MALAPGQTMESAYGKKFDPSWQPVASSTVKAQAAALDQGKSITSAPTRSSDRSTKGQAATKLGDEGGRRKKSRRHSKKTKRTRRRHTRKH